MIHPTTAACTGLTGAISTPVKNVFAAAFRLSCTTYLPLRFVVKRLSEGESESEI